MWNAMEEELEAEYWAKYDDVRERYHEEMQPDIDEGDPVYGCGLQERYEAAGAVCKAFMALRKADDDEIPF